MLKFLDHLEEWLIAFLMAGATVIGVDPPDGTPDHMVMADPEGNEFCVL